MITIADCLPPAFLPRALFERFNIEAIATTESPLDDLRWHRMIRDSGWKGRVMTAYRPDAVVDPEFAGFTDNVAAFWRTDGRRHLDWEGYLRRPPRAPRLFQGVWAPLRPITAIRPRAPRTSPPKRRSALHQGMKGVPTRRSAMPSAVTCSPKWRA
jgi:hypothetical protein